LLSLAAVSIAVFGSMLIEARRAAANEAAQRERGGLEPAHDVYPVMRVAYPAAFLAMIAEGFERGVPRASLLLFGATLFVAAKAVKWWAIVTLGSFWTFRVIVVPGTSPVITGPYRHLRHPNYLAVLGELIAVALMTGAVVTGPFAVIGFGLLILKRIAVEERALGAILRRN
jgi:methyltransferase